uniref:Uncharacterized protein n=1 Tax=Spongospora subterranea TaxID=70186 RepID=A0A0H5R8W9_9EUKA|eukprot:CRZ10573.1 hypothetical protein [Spongospora subterranea]
MMTMNNVRRCVRRLSQAQPMTSADMTKSTRKAFFKDAALGAGASDWLVDPRASVARPQDWWHVDGRIKEAIWQLHSSEPGKWTVLALSDQFGLHTNRIEAILHLKHDEKTNWKPEDLHDDLEAAAESAIELYRLEHKCIGQNDESPDVQLLHSCYELIYAYIKAVQTVEKTQSNINKTEQETERLHLKQELDAALETQHKSFNSLRSLLRPDLSRPVQDFEMFEPKKHGKFAPPPVFDLAIQGRLLPLPTQGPGSGKVIVDAETAAANRHRTNRHTIIITDISKDKSDGAVKVVVRQKDGSLRHPTRNELERATQMEKAVPRDRNVLYDD